MHAGPDVYVLCDSVCPSHSVDPGCRQDHGTIVFSLLVVQFPQPGVQVAPDVSVAVLRVVGFELSRTSHGRGADDRALR